MGLVPSTPRRLFAAVDWVFNGWGAGRAQWDRDEKIGAFVAGLAGTPVVSSPLVNEASIQVDGEGTVLVTQTVQRTPAAIGITRRRRGRAGRTIGTTHVVWLPRRMTRDSAHTAPAGTSTSSPRSPHRADCSCNGRSPSGLPGVQRFAPR